MEYPEVPDRGSTSFSLDQIGDFYTHEQAKFLAQHPSLSPELSERLSTSENPETREKLASNAATPEPILAVLLADGVDYVRKAAARNPRCPPEWVRRTSEQDESEDVREAAAMALRRREG